VKDFARSNKEGLARAVWLAHRGDVSTATLVAQICIDYRINDARIWAELLLTLGGGGASQNNGGGRDYSDTSENERVLLLDILETLARVSTKSIWRLSCVVTAVNSFLSAVKMVDGE